MFFLWTFYLNTIRIPYQNVIDTQHQLRFLIWQKEGNS